MTGRSAEEELVTAMQNRMTAAQLGDSSADFCLHYGQPLSNKTLGLGVLRQYAHGAQALQVLFVEERAVALFSTHAAGAMGAGCDQLTPRDVMPESERATAHGRTFVGDRGWVVALAGCPQKFITRLLGAA